MDSSSPSAQPAASTAQTLNVLSLVFLGLTLLSCLCMLIVFINPQVFFNPFKPLVRPAAGRSSTPAPAPTTMTFPTLPPEWTATVAPEGGATATATPQPSPTSVAPGFAGAATATTRPSPVGPTVTKTETQLPTRTPTRTPQPPTSTPLPRSYPPLTPPTLTPTVIGYP